MRVIELLGPSGVGKTFLYRRLFDVYTERSYMNVAEACIKAAGELRTGLEFSRRCFYSLLLRSGLCRFKAQGLSRRLLLGQEELYPPAETYSTSFELLKSYLKAEQDLRVFSKRIENFRRCVQLNFVLEKQLSADAIVLFDEGVLHHHHGLSIHAVAQHAVSKRKTDKGLNPCAVVSCELAFDQTMDRILKRRAGGIQTFSHKGLSEQSLAAYVRQNISEYQHKIAALRAAEIPVLVLNTDESVSANLNTMHTFITNLT